MRYCENCGHPLKMIWKPKYEKTQLAGPPSIYDDLEEQFEIEQEWKCENCGQTIEEFKLPFVKRQK